MAAQPVVLERQHAGLNTPSRAVTEQTVLKMCDHIRNAVNDPLLVQITRQTIAKAPGGSPSAHLAALWYWVKLHVKFVHDETLTRELLNESNNFELLISPPVLIRMARPRGDCDDFTMLLNAMAQIAGFETRICTVMCDRQRPGEYSHVYGEAFLPDRGIWCPIDASHGANPGWEVPARDILHKTAWNMNGQAVAEISGQPGGLGSVPQPQFLNQMPVYDTGLPIIGTIDLKNPFEWLALGGAGLSLLFANSGSSKLAGAAGFLGVRFILAKMLGNW